MLSAIKIKEEPLDEIEDLQEICREEVLIKQEVIAEPFGHSLPSYNFNIVEEQESIITVSNADMRSEHEKRFIESITSTDPHPFKEVCPKCLTTFTNCAQFLKHNQRNHCVTKKKCPVCPITFIDAASLLNHLNLHRENSFFCSHHCGVNFGTLPLCEEHELTEHKIQTNSKIRYKHFCSFCRQGFKTELQLHVHWLQKTHGCGKIMQDVVLYSSNVASSYDTNIKNSKNLLLDKQSLSANTNSVSIIPITKLRLKYSATTAPQTPKKRQIDNACDETTLKRMKTIDQIKQTESNQLPFKFETDIQIKEEPADEYENPITSSLIPEVIIKTEEEDKIEETEIVNEKPPMRTLLINNMIGPESNGKFIPLQEFVTSENITFESRPENTKFESRREMKTFSINNLVKPNANNKEEFVTPENTKIESRPEMKTFSFNDFVKSNANGKVTSINMNSQNLPVLKIVNNNVSNISLNNINNETKKNESKLRFVKIAPAPMPVANNNVKNFNFTNIKSCSVGKIIPVKPGNSEYLTYSDIKPLPKSGLQIIKFLPNTHMMTIKPNNVKNNNILLRNKEPLIIKLKTPTTTDPAVPNLKAISTPPTLVTTTPKIEACNPSIVNTTTSPTVSIKLNSLEQNTTIDAEDFKKLQTEAIIKAEEHRKNFYVPKTRLMIIENIPERKQLIDSMKQKIAEVETKTTEQIQGKPVGSYLLRAKPTDEPASLYLPIFTTMDVSLIQARYQNPNYNYKWICPYCMKDYEIKSALKVHLIKAHNLNNRDMEKINVQAKPYIYEEEHIEEIKPQIKEEQALSQDTDSQLLETSETESIIADNTPSLNPQSVLKASNIKHQKSRYICEKCGRTCSSKTMLSDHILANCSREPQYSCKECTKKFFSHGTLQCHMTIHTGELPHKCNYCDKRFRTRGQVKVHHRTHTGERPFFCQVCSQRFTHRETLIAHLSRHIGMKRYKCYGCDKNFSCISALKTHRDIRADTCGKVKFNPRAIGPRVRVIRGNVMFEPQPEINPYLKSEDPKNVLSELQNESALQTS